MSDEPQILTRWVDPTIDDFKIALEEANKQIEKDNKEIEILNNVIVYDEKEIQSLTESNNMLEMDNNRLINIINELEKYLVEKEMEHNHNREVSYRVYKDIENKIKELKGSNKE